MKTAKLLIMLSAFLIMISCVFTLMATTDRTGVYLNVGAMFALVIAISVMNFKNNPEKRQ
ncbi:hypothetical protein [Odoribacter lunatus]|uniref:hypothetical protein n=1 Tax=Odoribacter lunatus TaxID=2941335 RepID=UPI00203EBE64|nr:hypothetical protein [Odoribacter lunatus]